MCKHWWVGLRIQKETARCSWSVSLGYILCHDPVHVYTCRETLMPRAADLWTLTTVGGGLIVLLVALTMGLAQDDHERAKRLKDAGEIIPLEKILDTVREDHRGRLLEVAFRDEQGRLIYEVEIVDAQGVVWYLHYDARHGTLLRTKKDTTP
jgi:hypothetical protein